MFVKRIFFLLCLFQINMFILTSQETVPNRDKELLNRGYILTEYPHISIGEEVKFYQIKNKKIETTQRVWKEIDHITYKFNFLSKTEPNNTVIAFFIDDNNQEKEYFKVNTNNEPATLWIEFDINNDGVISDGEGRYAWY